MSILFVEQLTVIDCARLDAERGLVGESWIVDIELEGALDEQSMVLDFSTVKRQLKKAVDAGLDHRLLVPAQAAGLQVEHDGDRLVLDFPTRLGRYRHESPACAVAMLPYPELDRAAVETALQAQLRPELPGSVSGLRVQLRDEFIDGASYQYVHGLKKHDGACQRIAHGHRSRIEVRVGGERSAVLERQLADAWADIYLATRADLSRQGPDWLEFAYHSREGSYRLQLPAQRCQLMDADTTVERIAELLLERLASQLGSTPAIEVRAYEGVMKGAIARRA